MVLDAALYHLYQNVISGSISTAPMLVRRPCRLRELSQFAEAEALLKRTIIEAQPEN